ncbi:helix-turn-helix domain-containing protein [Bacillus sp. APMAM]|uniref:helix-turn-helix domain-containing protein n=1 Tax=Margalitia sp. FSL K6-0131 TaxID=2954604 RepID=UPI000F861909|nr:helix-turn-helix domain-containing protein [Bacillus sp. APMAM]RTZ54411.1 helix-turn-helix domain-containing protein [Bacillus sp. SAJ1]
MNGRIENIHYICQLIFEAHHLSVFYINQYGEFEFECSPSQFQTSPYYDSLKFRMMEYTAQQETIEIPIFFSYSNLQFFSIHLNQTSGVIIVGPCIHTEITEEKMNAIMDSYKELPHKRALFDFYQALPVITSEQFLTIGLLTFSLFYEQLLDKSYVLKKNKELDSTLKLSDHPDLELSKGRRNFSFHSNLSHERVLLHYVKNGQIEKLSDVVNYSIFSEDELGVLSKRSRIRSEKNLMITGVALICRAAVEGGLNEETAFTLSDFYIQQLEEQDNLKAIQAIMSEVLYDFTNRVHQAKENKYSRTITSCLHYIYNHLYEDITLEMLAELTHLSPNYLSSLFKKEMGTSISHYIQSQRIEEAKKLLSLTKYPISDIGSWLNFNDQSYFIRVFKKHTGMTPKKYRDSFQE